MIYTLPPLASHMFPCLRPNWPISALSSDSSANANCTHAVLFHFIVSPTHHFYFSEPMHSPPNPILDVVLARCKPVVTPELKIPSKWRYKKTYGRIPTKWDTL